MKTFQNLYEKNELQDGKCLAKSVDRLMCEPLYNVQRQQGQKK